VSIKHEDFEEGDNMISKIFVDAAAVGVILFIGI
jgi:hypothetical protein